MFGFEAFDFNLPSSGGQMRVEKVQPPPPQVSENTGFGSCFGSCIVFFT